MAEPAGGGNAQGGGDALRQALEERNRLWEELQRARASEQEAAYWRERAENLEGSIWWRIGTPLRLAKRAARDPADAFEILAGRLRERRRG